MRPRSVPPIVAVLALAWPTAAQTTVHTVFGEAAWDNLGQAVAGVGDVNGDQVGDFAVGANLANANNSSGRVLVYSGADASVLHSFDGDGSDDELGYSVAGAGDVNGDGYPDIVAGAPEHDGVAGSSSGRAKVFSGLDGTLLHQFDGSTWGARLGHSVAAAGDVNQDGYADIVVGAPDAPTGVWVFSGADGQVLYSFAGESGNDRFGWSVHGGRDIDLDGYPDILVGAFGDDNAGTNSGSVTAYSGRDGTTVFRRNGDVGGERFGYAVALLGDVDGDGRADVAAGAPYANAGAVDTGLLRILSGATGETLFEVAGGPNDFLGLSVAPAGDVDGDSVIDVIVGAPFADRVATDAGAAHVLSGVDGTRLTTIRGTRQFDRLGTSVGAVGDLNGDLLVEVIVGVPGDDDSGQNAGTARVVDGFVDCNANGVHDGLDLVAGRSADCNGNATPDECDLAAGTSPDCNADGTPDECEPDCNGNGVPDDCDLSAGVATDCNLDGVLDECQVPLPRFQDVSPDFPTVSGNVTHVHTIPVPPAAASDVILTFAARGDLETSFEFVTVWLNGTWVASAFGTDEFAFCEEETDQVALSRTKFNDLVAGGDAVFELDPPSWVSACSGSHIQLSVDYDYFVPADCNGNGLEDACDVVSGTSQDQNLNGVPDECEFANYCTPAANSSGWPALISWSGSSSVAQNDLTLFALPLPAFVNGLFIYSPDQAYLPLGDGFLCLGDTTQGFVNRLPFETSNASGTMTHALDLTMPPHPSSIVLPGSTWNFQCWFRDPFAGGAGFNFSDALRVLFLP